MFHRLKFITLFKVILFLHLFMGNVTHLFFDVVHFKNLLPAFAEEDGLGAFTYFICSIRKGSIHFFKQHGNLNTDMKMLVSGPNKETTEIPIYDLEAIDHDVIVARELYEVARINQRLRKEGFELDVRPEYYTGKLNDGRQLIVPVKHVGFKPYGL